MTAAAFLSGRRSARASQGVSFYGASWLDTLAAWTLALLWLLPLAYAVWTAFHPSDASTRLDLSAPWTLQNFAMPGKPRRLRAIFSTPSCWWP